MREGGYEMTVVGGEPTDEEDVVRLEHGQIFHIVLSNLTMRPCDVALKIDGQEIGAWSLSRLETIKLDHSELDTRLFRFMRPGSREADEMNDLFHHCSGWVIALFVPHAPERLPPAPELVARGVEFTKPKLSDLTLYDGEGMVCLEILLDCEPLPVAEFEVLPFQVVECPECCKESRVPEGLGYLRIRCPHCSAQFARKT